MRNWARVGLAVLAAGALAVGCGDSDDEPDETTGAATTEASVAQPTQAVSETAEPATTAAETAAGTETAEATDAASVAAPAQGGRLVIAAAQGIPQLDPHKILFQWEQVLYPLLWDTLTEFTPEGGTEIQPNLATAWEGSDDQKTWTFTLADGVTFADGKKLTADVVVESFKRALDPETAFIWTFGLPAVADVTAPDASTVQFTLETASSTFPTAVATVPVIDVANIDGINTTPNVTGPYTVSSFEPDNKVVLARNPNAFGIPGGPDEIEIVRAQDNTAAVTSLRAGDIQALWSIPYSDVAELESEGSGDVAIVAGANQTSSVIMMTDNTSPPFDNATARLALAHAVNKQGILEGVYANKGILSPANVPIPTSHPLYDSTLPEIPFDLDRAKELFAEAGINDGDTLTYWAPAGQYGEWTTMGEVLQADLEQIGITLEIETAELSQWAERFAPAGKKWERMIVPNIYGGFPVPLTTIFWTPGICECNFDNAEYNEAVAAAGSAPPEEQAAAYATVQQVFAREAPVVVIGQSDALIGVRSEVSGVWIDPAGLARFELASIAS